MGAENINLAKCKRETLASSSSPFFLKTKVFVQEVGIVDHFKFSYWKIL